MTKMLLAHFAQGREYGGKSIDFFQRKAAFFLTVSIGSTYVKAKASENISCRKSEWRGE